MLKKEKTRKKSKTKLMPFLSCFINYLMLLIQAKISNKLCFIELSRTVTITVPAVYYNSVDKYIPYTKL